MEKPKPSNGNRRPSRRQIQILVKAPQAREVAIVGDFSRWDEAGIRLSKSDGGEWRTTLMLDPGEYQYRLKIDGEWRDHPEAQKRVPNPFGSENCVLRVD